MLRGFITDFDPVRSVAGATLRMRSSGTSSQPVAFTCAGVPSQLTNSLSLLSMSTGTTPSPDNRTVYFPMIELLPHFPPVEDMIMMDAVSEPLRRAALEAAISTGALGPTCDLLELSGRPRRSSSGGALPSIPPATPRRFPFHLPRQSCHA